jgi:hypothetical protein
MKRLLVCASMALALSACGGSTDDESSSTGASALTGTWYSPAVRTSWTFNSDRTGTIRTSAYDGSSCQITAIEFTVNSAGNNVTYYGTRYQQKSTPAHFSDYNQTVRKGPYSAAYTLSGARLSIGNGTYSRGSAAC